MDISTSLLMMRLMQIPGVLIALAAGGYAAARWSRHPLTSLLVISAVSVRLLLRGALMVLPAWYGPSTTERFMALEAVVGTLTTAALLAAAFTERGTKADPPAQRW